MATTQHAVRRPAVRHPRWLPPLSLGLSVLGLVFALYLSYEHLTQNKTLACAESSTINCAKVTESQWSAFLGIPVAYLGVLFFVSMVALTLPQVYRRSSRVVDLARVAWCAVGLVFALYLVFAELYHIKAICLWCTGVHVITLVLLLTLIFGSLLTERD